MGRRTLAVKTTQERSATTGNWTTTASNICRTHLKKQKFFCCCLWLEIFRWENSCQTISNNNSNNNNKTNHGHFTTTTTTINILLPSNMMQILRQLSVFHATVNVVASCVLLARLIAFPTPIISFKLRRTACIVLLLFLFPLPHSTWPDAKKLGVISDSTMNL